MKSTLAIFLLLLATMNAQVEEHPSATDVLADMYNDCLKDLSVNCIKPRALKWIDLVSGDPVIHITEDLTIVRDQKVPVAEQRGNQDIYDRFEEFLVSHRLVAKVPQLLRPNGPLGDLIPRSFNAEDADVPLAVTGRSKFVKKVMIPFLLGLKFKTVVLVPLAFALIALKTWKAMTLGLLSLVLTGALLIFKFSKPKVVNYEVVHYPHPHHHHIDHHLEHAPVAWDHTGYGRELTSNNQEEQLAYRGHTQ